MDWNLNVWQYAYKNSIAMSRHRFISITIHRRSMIHHKWTYAQANLMLFPQIYIKLFHLVPAIILGAYTYKLLYLYLFKCKWIVQFLSRVGQREFLWSLHQGLDLDPQLSTLFLTTWRRKFWIPQFGIYYPLLMFMEVNPTIFLEVINFLIDYVACYELWIVRVTICRL